MNDSSSQFNPFGSSGTDNQSRSNNPASGNPPPAFGNSGISNPPGLQGSDPGPAPAPAPAPAPGNTAGSAQSSAGSGITDHMKSFIQGNEPDPVIAGPLPPDLKSVPDSISSADTPPQPLKEEVLNREVSDIQANTLPPLPATNPVQTPAPNPAEQDKPKSQGRNTLLLIGVLIIGVIALLLGIYAALNA